MVRWLTDNKRKKTRSSIVIEFTTPKTANKAISSGVQWNGQKYKAECDYSVDQCTHCQQFGHVVSDCINTETWRYCAGLHASKNCLVKDAGPFKCANCRKDHKVNSKACKVWDNMMKQRPSSHPESPPLAPDVVVPAKWGPENSSDAETEEERKRTKERKSSKRRRESTDREQSQKKHHVRNRRERSPSNSPDTSSSEAETTDGDED